jgi:hypothetical protein
MCNCDYINWTSSKTKAAVCAARSKPWQTGSEYTVRIAGVQVTNTLDVNKHHKEAEQLSAETSLFI